MVMNLSKTTNPKYYCKYTRVAPDAECHLLSACYDLVVSCINGMIREKSYNLLNSKNTDVLSTLDANSSQYTVINKLIIKHRNENSNLYEQFILNEISKDEYINKRAVILTDLTRLNNIKNALTDEKNKTIEHNSNIKLATQLSSEKELSQKTVDLLVEKVLIFPDDKVDVKWKKINHEYCQ
jgi:hypothetical protein